MVMTTGAGAFEVDAGRVAEHGGQFVWTILATCWPGVTEAQHVLADRLDADLLGKSLTTARQNVGFEQQRRRLAQQRLVDRRPRTGRPRPRQAVRNPVRQPGSSSAVET